MRPISRLEQDSRLDGAVSAGQRMARHISFRLAGGANQVCLPGAG
jgi:hypothetical protein